ncbi:MAG: hypothetical protein MUW56_03330 [Chryseobacterium sp.]|uniref:hypothetical protein n=1 Tax=Chryseobacterium sp. TaxID=1871047 RepID=UPI0025C3D85F|nr:hypothetical protein [Chryseobacterium sp.]MCJ7932680.1 hypothetical protein [Chryseobacterium sp.]
MTTENIYQAIRNWKTLIKSYQSGNSVNETEILGYLNQGTHFSVSGEEIKKWKTDLENEDTKKIHAYVGLDNGKMKFFLIDSKSDKEARFDTIIIKEFTRESPDMKLQETSSLMVSPPITSEAAINRNFRWNMFCTQWIKAQQTGDFFQLISIPFSDYELLELENDHLCTSFFGLTDDLDRKNSDFPYHIEIITVKDLTIYEMSKMAENYSTPRPPFTVDTVEDYQLLKKSGAFL